MALWNDQAVVATGLNGLAQGRFVGVTASGAPPSGTFAVGDYVVSQNGNILVCTVTGTPGTWVTPSNSSNALAAGEEAYSRDLVSSNAGQMLNQNLRLTYFTARKSETTTQVRVITGSTAAGATPTYCAIGLYLIDDSTGNGTLVASTGNDTTLFAAGNTPYTRSWIASYAKVAGLRYAVGMLVSSGATQPTMSGVPNTSSILTAEWNIAPRLCGVLTTQSTLPSTFTNASLTNSSSRHYAVVLP